MKKNRNLKSVALSLTLAFAFVFLLSSNTDKVFAAETDSPEIIDEINEDGDTPTNVVNIALYEDKWFTIESEAEPVTLHMEADSISLYGICNNPSATELLTCTIQGIDDDNSDFYQTVGFVANGSITTVFLSVPAGEYRVFFTGGTEYIRQAIVFFTVVL